MFGNLFKNETLQKTILKKFTEKLREEGTKQVLITLLDNDEIEIIKIDKENNFVNLKESEIITDKLRYNYLLKFFTEHKSLLN